MSEWQPIETAPKETCVLIWDGSVDVAKRDQLIWQGSTGWITKRGTASVKPTHWMPLPAPPESRP